MFEFLSLRMSPEVELLERLLDKWLPIVSIVKVRFALEDKPPSGPRVSELLKISCPRGFLVVYPLMEGLGLSKNPVPGVSGLWFSWF